MTQTTASLSIRLAALERKHASLPQLKAVMAELATQIQDAEAAGVMLGRIEQAMSAPLEVEAPVKVKAERPKPRPASDQTRQPTGNPQPVVLAYLDAHPGEHSASEVEQALNTQMGRTSARRALMVLADRHDIQRLGLGTASSPYRYAALPSAEPEEVQDVAELYVASLPQPDPDPAAEFEPAPLPQPKAAPAPQPKPRTERIFSHEANLPRDLPPVPTKPPRVSPESQQKILAALKASGRPMSPSLLASRVRDLRFDALMANPAVLGQSGQIVQDGGQWRAA